MCGGHAWSSMSVSEISFSLSSFNPPSPDFPKSPKLTSYTHVREWITVACFCINLSWNEIPIYGWQSGLLPALPLFDISAWRNESSLAFIHRSGVAQPYSSCHLHFLICVLVLHFSVYLNNSWFPSKETGWQRKSLQCSPAFHLCIG